MQPTDDETSGAGTPAETPAGRHDRGRGNPAPTQYYPSLDPPPAENLPTQPRPTIPRQPSGPSWMVGTGPYKPDGTTSFSREPAGSAPTYEPAPEPMFGPRPTSDAGPMYGGPLYGTGPGYPRDTAFDPGPTSGAGFGAQPTSGGPGFGAQPTSGGPGFQPGSAAVPPPPPPDRTGTVYSTGRLPTPGRRVRPASQGRDWLIVGALGFLGLAVLVGGGFFLEGLSSSGTPSAAASTRAPATTAPPAAPVPAPTTAAAPSPTAGPTPTAAPTTQPAAPAASVVRSALSALCMDTPPGGDPEGTHAIANTCDGQPSQRWTAQPYPQQGVYALVNMASGKCLDVWGASTDDNAVGVQWHCHGGANQQWRPQQNGNGYLLVNVNSGKCLGVQDGNPAAGAQLVQWSCDNSAAQTWTFS